VSVISGEVQTIQNIVSVSSDATTLTFLTVTPQLMSLSPGDVIVIGVTPNTPYGLLRRITTVVMNGNQVIIETTQATLEDAIEDGTIEINQVLTPADLNVAVAMQKGIALEGVGTAGIQALASEGFYLSIDDVVIYDKDGNHETQGDQIKASGSIAIDPDFIFNLKIEDRELENVSFFFNANETLEISAETEVDLLDIEKKIELARYNFAPITLWIGWVPVIISPILTLNVGLDGEVSVGIEAGVTQEATLTAGLIYENQTFVPVSDLSFAIEPDGPRLSTDCKFKAYAGPQFNLLLYSLAGPYTDLNGYLELDADLFRTPWWELYGGIEAGVGIRVEIFSNELVDYYAPSVIGYRKLLAHADMTSRGSIAGIVKDAVSQTPLQDVSVDVYSEGALIAIGKTDSSGYYSLQIVAGDGYMVHFSKEGYLPTTYHDVSVDADTITHLEAVLQIDEIYSGSGTASGKIFHALTGVGVGSLIINLREGINAINGTIVGTTVTASDGSYAFNNLTAGHYTAEVSGVGYVTTYFSLICIGGTETNNQNATITPILSPGETRIVLTWGQTPSDLDSHLTGPLPDGSRFHLFYPYADANAGSPWPEYVRLDLDDVTSYGPETTTIYQQIEGVYRFSVHDYSNRYSSNSSALSTSGAQVRVYRGSTLVANFNVPSNQSGTLWTVFELSGDTIAPINSMSYESAPGNIESFSLVRTVSADAPLMLNLPEKR